MSKQKGAPADLPGHNHRKAGVKRNGGAALEQSFTRKLKESGLDNTDSKRLQFELCELAPKGLELQGAGFVIPYFDLSGRRTAFYRYRILQRKGWDALTAEQKRQRYTQPAKSAPELYLPPLVDWRKAAADASQPLVITEGELKAACGCKLTAYPTIGLGGVENWKATKRGLAWLPQFNLFQWEGRRVYIAFDSDAATNENVQRAERGLAAVAAQWGALVHVVRVPYSASAKVGLDDYVTAHGAQAWAALIDGTPPYRQDAASADNRPAMHVVELAAKSEPPVPMTFALASLLPHRNVTLLSGNGGAGKSNLALTLCAHVAAGKDWNGFAATQGRVMLVSMEDEADTLRRRLAHIVATYRLDEAAVRESLRLVDATDDEFLAVECAANGERYLRTTASFEAMADRIRSYAPALVVIDNASEAFGANENERRMVRSFMRTLARLARTHGAAVMLLAHIDKAAARSGGNGNTFSGSSAWHNGPRSRLVLVPDSKAPDRVILSVEKHQYSGPVPDMRLTWTAEGVLKPDGIVADAERKDNGIDAAAVYDALAAMIAEGVTVPAVAGGPKQTCNFLLDSGRLGWKQTETKRVNAALNRLVADGKIQTETYKDRYRKEREKYVLCAPLPASKVRQSHAPGSPSGAKTIPLVRR